MKHIKIRPSLFWDADPKSIDVKKNARYVIERILEYGNENDVRWMFKNFELLQIKDILSESRNISRKSANFWSLILGLPPQKLLCLKKSYQKMRKSHWPY